MKLAPTHQTPSLGTWQQRTACLGHVLYSRLPVHAWRGLSGVSPRSPDSKIPRVTTLTCWPSASRQCGWPWILFDDESRFAHPASKLKRRAWVFEPFDAAHITLGPPPKGVTCTPQLRQRHDHPAWHGSLRTHCRSLNHYRSAPSCISQPSRPNPPSGDCEISL